MTIGDRIIAAVKIALSVAMLTLVGYLFFYGFTGEDPWGIVEVLW